MATGQALSRIVQVVLMVVIVVLSYGIYRSIVDPRREQAERAEMQRLSRLRMEAIRAVLVRYGERQGRFPATLDSILVLVRTDSTLRRPVDSLLDGALDSILIAPRSGRRFEYRVNDTARMRTYLIKDPDSDDYIGTDDGDVSRLHAASWE